MKWIQVSYRGRGTSCPVVQLIVFEPGMGDSRFCQPERAGSVISGRLGVYSCCDFELMSNCLIYRSKLPREQLAFNPDNPTHADGFAANHDHTLCLRDSLDLACLDSVLATVLTAVWHEILHGHDRVVVQMSRDNSDAAVKFSFLVNRIRETARIRFTFL